MPEQSLKLKMAASMNQGSTSQIKRHVPQVAVQFANGINLLLRQVKLRGCHVLRDTLRVVRLGNDRDAALGCPS